MPFSTLSAIERETEAALAQAIRSDAIPIEAKAGAGYAAALAAEVVAARIAPLVDHATNAEPWYQSRVTLGALLSAATPLLALAGLSLGPEHREAIVSAIVGLAPLVGAAVTLYGRWRARKPVGA